MNKYIKYLLIIFIYLLIYFSLNSYSKIKKGQKVKVKVK
jgi:hypothetical protein